MSRRNTWRWFDYSVFCQGCDWKYFGKNGLGLAAQHHDKYGHSVNVEVTGGVSYLNDEDDAKQRVTANRICS